MEWASEPGEDETFGIDPENVLPFAVFTSMSSQWLWTGGMESRRAGLNHLAMPLHMRKCGVPLGQRYAVMDDVQVMECAALATWNEMAS